MNNFFEDFWYEDLMDVYRLQDVKKGNVKSQQLVLVYEKVECKMYRTAQAGLTQSETSGSINESNSVAYSTDITINAGDEIHLWQYGETDKPYEKYIAGKEKEYKGEVGGVDTGLQHKQCSIEMKKRT